MLYNIKYNKMRNKGEGKLKKRFIIMVNILFCLSIILPSISPIVVVQAIDSNQETTLVEQKENQDEQQIIADLTSGQVYDTVKKTEAQITTNSQEFSNNMEKDEFKDDYESSIETDYLVPKTDANFEVALAKDNGEFIFVEGTDTLEEAVEIAKTQDVEIGEK